MGYGDETTKPTLTCPTWPVPTLPTPTLPVLPPVTVHVGLAEMLSETLTNKPLNPGFATYWLCGFGEVT